MSRNHLVPASLLALTLLIGAGCSPDAAPTEALKPPQEEAQTPPAVPADDDGRTANGDLVQRGENLSLPANFPTDVPIYEGAAIEAVTTVAAADAASVLLTTTDPVTMVTQWYDARTSDGWSVRASTDATDKTTRAYEKPGYDLKMTIERKEGLTNITVLRVKKEGQ